MVMIKMIIDTDKYVDAVSAAQMLGITDARIRVLVKTQRLGETIRVGHTRLIPIEAVQNFKRLPPGVKKKTSNKEVMMCISNMIAEAKKSGSQSLPPVANDKE